MSDDEVKIVTPEEFRVRLSTVGTDTSNSGYDTWTDKSAMKLAIDTVKVLSKEMVGEKNSTEFRFELAVMLLATTQGVDYSEFEDTVMNVKDDFERSYKETWTIEQLYENEEEQQ